MKKILFLGGLMLSAMTFVSCDDDFADWASPQSNPQEEAITLPGYQASAVAAIDLAAVTGDSVQVLSLSSVTLPEGAVVENTRIEVLPSDGSSTEATTINVDGQGRIAVAELQSTIETYYGKRPTARDLSTQVYSNIVTGGQAFLVDAGQITVTATPVAPYIASAYYLVGDVTGGWDAAHVVSFAHSGADVYEDPVFTVTFNAAAGNCWKIIPQGNIDSGDFWHSGTDGVVGVAQDGDTSLSGTLVTQSSNGGEAGAGKIENAGFYRMTINMLDYTYTIEAVAGTYYLVGALQGWSDSDKSCPMYPSSATVHTYTTQWTGDGNLKIWEASAFGNWDVAYGSPTNDDTSASGQLVNSGAGSIKVPTANEYYTFTVDMGTMTYTWTKLDTPASYSTIGIIGGFNNWNADADIDMTQVAGAPHNWTLRYTFSSDTELKFRANDAWDVSWGEGNNIGDRNYGTGDTNNAPNLNVPAGTYNIYFNDITGQYLFIAE